MTDLDDNDLAMEIGMTRRRRRSMRSISNQSYARKNVITELPSRTNAASPELVGGGGDVVDDVETQAVRIFEQMQNEKVDETSKSVKDQLVTLRGMTQSLTLRKTVRSKLLRKLERHENRNELPFTARMGRSFNEASMQMTDSWKELLVRIEPWYKKLKTIEGHFGSGVATYFKFLRSLLFINCVVFLVSLVFVVVPQIILIANKNATETSSPTFSFGNLFTGEGYLSETVLFYGYYANETLSFGNVIYSMPSAYFFSALASYVLVFLLLSISMATSFRKSFIENAGSEKNVYANKVFCAWDFGISKAETADLKSKSIQTEFKELLEEQNTKRKKRSWWQMLYLWGMQASLNLLLLSCLAVGGFYSWSFLSSLHSPIDTQTAMMISLTVTVVIHLGPMFLIWLLRFEEYESPRTATYVTIARTFILDAFLIGVLVAYRLHVSNSDICWETALGQEIYRLVLLDFLIGLVGTSLAQFVRRLLYLKVWSGFGYPELDVARNTINLLYNEALFFVGLYFSPILSLVIIIKLMLTFYVRYWGAVRDCRPSERMWRAAQTQTVFLTTAFIAFILVIILYGYILSTVQTSMCGPFRGKKYTYQVIVDSLAEEESSVALRVIFYVRKPGVVAVILILMLLGVYYVRAVGRARARVVRILQDVLHLQAKDKDYLLQMLSQLSNRNATTHAVRFESEHEVRLPSSGTSSMDRRRSRNVRDLYSDAELREFTAKLLDAERTSNSAPALRFNPVFTESVPEPQISRSDHQSGRLNMTQNEDGSFIPEPGSKYTPNVHDDRVPSRIGFPGPPRSARRRI